MTEIITATIRLEWRTDDDNVMLLYGGSMRMGGIRRIMLGKRHWFYYPTLEAAQSALLEAAKAALTGNKTEGSPPHE